MTKASKPLSPAGLVSYHKEALSAPSESAYHLENGQVPTSWHGELVEELGLEGKPANVERVQRLANGQHPETGEQLVKKRTNSTEQPWIKTGPAWREHLEKMLATGADPFRKVAPHATWKPDAIAFEGKLQLPERDADQRTLIEIQEAAKEFYSARLVGEDGHRGRDYLDKRGITEESRGKFGLGVSGSGNELLSHMREKFGAEERFTRGLMLESGLFYENEDGELQDRFKNRLMFPIQDAAGETVAFAGRRLDEKKEGKYVNSKNSRIYVKGETVYNLHRAAAVGSGRIVGVEGYLDVIQSDQNGVHDTVALGGVSLSGSKTSTGKAAAPTEQYRPKPGDFDASRIPIMQLWRDLGGGDLRGKRGKAFWRDGDGYNIAINTERGVWHDKAGSEGGGGTVRLAAVVLGVDDKEAWRYLKEHYGEGVPLPAPVPKPVTETKPNGPTAIEQIKSVAHTFIFNLDGDEAGKAATEKHIAGALQSGLTVRALSLDGDPDEFARKHGATAYATAVAGAKPVVEWLTQRAREKFDLNEPDQKAAALRWVTQSFADVQAEQREAINEEISRHLNLPIAEKERAKHAERRAGIDIVFSPPKSFSVQALVGGTLEDGTVIPGDERLVASHNRGVRAALDSMQDYAQARMRDVHPETTRRWVAALFLHDTARPVDDHSPNPHLHTHSVIFNLTNSAEHEKFKSMDPNWLYRIQGYGNAVYISEMANDAREFGYQLERGKNFSLEIRGLSKEYLQAMSLRNEDIEQKKAEQGKVGAAAGEFVNYETRQAKQQWEPEALAEQHRKEAEAWGVNPAAVHAAARERGGFYISAEVRQAFANEALDYAKERLFEGQAVNSHHEIMRDALRYRPDLLRERDVIAAFNLRRQEFITVHHYRRDAPKEHYTTPEMQKIERQSIDMVLRGRGAVEPISELTKQDFAAKYKVRKKPDGTSYEMTRPQMAMAWKAVTSTDQFQIVAGAAGAGKSSSFEVVAEIAEQHRQANFKIVGMAATSSATNNLKEMGVAAHTLQLHNARGVRPGTPKTLYLLDEGSLVGAQSFRKFLDTVRPQDRVIIAYDHRQHHSVEAGRIVEELELAGVKAIRLEDIMRQKSNPQLLPVIEKFRDSFGHRGSQNMIQGLQMLQEQGRLHEVGHRAKRFENIADYYAQDPHRTLIVTPDNRSIHEINLAVRDKLQRMGYVQADAHEAVILTGVRNLKSPDIALATSYEEGNVIRFNSAGTLGGRARVSVGQYATVLGIDPEKNEVTIRLGDAFGTRDVSYNPRMAKSAEIYESDIQQLAVGDKIRITRNWKLKPGDTIANNAVGRIVSLDAGGKGEILFDEGRDTERTVKWDAKEMPHIRLGYAMTSYSAQSMTVPRAAVHVDTGDSRIRPLLEKALLYVGASRPAEDVAIFTDDKDILLSPTESPILRQHDKPLALSQAEIEKAGAYAVEAPEEDRVHYGAAVA